MIMLRRPNSLINIRGITMLSLIITVGFSGLLSMAYSCPERTSLSTLPTISNELRTEFKWTVDLGSQNQTLPAFQAAIKTLFEKDAELESPLSIVHSILAEESPARGGDEESWNRSRQKLDQYLDSPDSTLVLLEGKDDGRGFLPEQGESTEVNWIFSLVIPELSDHVFWIVVPKDSSAKPYVYGFN